MKYKYLPVRYIRVGDTVYAEECLDGKPPDTFSVHALGSDGTISWIADYPTEEEAQKHIEKLYSEPEISRNKLKLFPSYDSDLK